MLWLTVDDHLIRQSFGARLDLGMGSLRHLGFEVDWTEHGPGDWIVDVQAEKQLEVRQSIGEIIADTVLNDFEPKLLHKAIVSLRPQYRGKGAAQMLITGLDLLNHSRVGIACEREAIVGLVAEYLQEYNVLHVDGFVRFRLQDYYHELIGCARQVIDDYESEKEREELISFLKEFVVDRTSEMRIVHVLPDPNHVFKIVDDQGRYIESGYQSEFDFSGSDVSDIDAEELLIASLITAVPGKVVFHMPWERMDMILEVFAGRIRFCPGCDRCMGQPERSTH